MSSTHITTEDAEVHGESLMQISYSQIDGERGARSLWTEFVIVK